MKIAHVVDSMEMGGTEMLVLQMSALQREQADEPSVYAVASLGALGERMQSDGFIVRANVGKHLLDSTRNFYRLFRELRPDVVHLHNPTPTIYAAMAARLAGVPSIVSTRHSLVAPPREATTEFKYAVAACFCNWIVGICEATTNNIKSMRSVPSRKIVRIYNGTARVLPAAMETRPPKTGFTLLYVGRLELVKNHALLLTAFRTALSSCVDLRLWIVGDGSERKHLEKQARDLGIAAEVTFWGQQLDVAPFFSAADAFIMSSLSEGLPVSLLQAFSLGLPSIVTNVGGMAEVVRMAQGGLAVSSTDPTEMAEAIQQLANDAGKRRQYSVNAEQAFEKHFTLRTMVESYRALYQDTRAGRREIP